MPAKAGIQYSRMPALEPIGRGVLDHPLSRMMTAFVCRLDRHSSRTCVLALRLIDIPTTPMG